ncbi:MAG: T9SS type A sorting domain-containing protein, partial [Flavobacteriales bacterium]
LGSHDSFIVAGGNFTATSGGSSVTAMHVAEFGAAGWAQVGDGLDAPVGALLDVNGTLYAGGDMFASSTATFGLARIDDGAATWGGLMPGLASYITENTGVTEVRALATDGVYVYIGGGFTLTQMTSFGSNVARFEGTADSFTPLADLDAPVKTLMSDANGLIAGGSFSENSGTGLPFLAQAQTSTGIHAPQYSHGVTLFPNPATNELTITLDQNIPANSTLEVVDVKGRSMIKRDLDQTTTTLDVSQLPAGAYIVRIEMNGAITNSPFVKR